MRKVFNNNALQTEFDKKGYVVIPFLNADEVASLTKYYFDTLDQRGGNMFGKDVDFDTDAEVTYDFTFTDKNSDYKKMVFNTISAAFEKHNQKYLADYKPIIANFIRKEKDGGEVPMHQNWAFIDERLATSVSIWCPLVDSNEENGTLQMVDGSHKRFGELRGPLIPWELEGITKEIIAKHLTPLNIKAGQAAVLDDSIVHYSNVNATNGLRLAIQLILVPREMSPIHHHLDVSKPNNSTVEVLEVDQNFFMHFHPWLRPKNTRLVKKLAFTPQKTPLKAFEARLNGPTYEQTPPLSAPKPSPPPSPPKPAEPQGFFSRIKALFNHFQKN